MAMIVVAMVMAMAMIVVAIVMVMAVVVAVMVMMMVGPPLSPLRSPPEPSDWWCMHGGTDG